ncbi:hypothetical protein ABXT54_03685 [Methylophilaceae bacterium Uisw_099_01]
MSLTSAFATGLLADSTRTLKSTGTAYDLKASSSEVNRKSFKIVIENPFFKIVIENPFKYYVIFKLNPRRIRSHLQT